MIMFFAPIRGFDKYRKQNLNKKQMKENERKIEVFGRK